MEWSWFLFSVGELRYIFNLINPIQSCIYSFFFFSSSSADVF